MTLHNKWPRVSAVSEFNVSLFSVLLYVLATSCFIDMLVRPDHICLAFSDYHCALVPHLGTALR